MNAEQRKLRNLAIILILILIGLQGALWFSSTGVSHVKELSQDVLKQEKEIVNLKQKNQTLEAEVNDLKQGLESVEERARSELGMIAKDETFFQLLEDDKFDGKESDNKNLIPENEIEKSND